MSDATWLSTIRARHDVSAPFVGNLDRASRAYNLAREDRAELLREYDALLAVLQKVAILSHHRMAQGGGTIPSGFSCEICDAECDHGQPLVHVGDCPLPTFNPK